MVNTATRRTQVLRWRSLMTACVLLLSACSTSAQLRTDDAALVRATETNPAAIEIYALTPGRAFDVLGPVVAAADGSSDPVDAMEDLREAAAELGATAVIETRIEGEYGYWDGAFKMSGIAVRWRP